MKKKLTYTAFEQSLLDSLQDTTVKKDNGKIAISSFMLLPASMSLFKGHFPQQPIFPAVLQLTLVRLLCAEVTQKKLLNISVGKTKFSGIIRPEEKIKIEIELSENQDEYKAKFRFFNGANLASSGCVNYITVNQNGTA